MSRDPLSVAFEASMAFFAVLVFWWFVQTPFEETFALLVFAAKLVYVPIAFLYEQLQGVFQ